MSGEWWKREPGYVRRFREEREMDELNKLVLSIKDCPWCKNAKHVYLQSWHNEGEVAWEVTCFWCENGTIGNTASEAVGAWNQLPREE